MKLHQQALSTKEMQQILKEKGNWDLVVASPFLNEVGVMLGKLGLVWVGQMPYFLKFLLKSKAECRGIFCCNFDF